MKFSSTLKGLFFLTLSVLLFLCCPTSNSAQNSPPTLVILNADVRTMDKQIPKAEAVAVTENKISAVGTNSQIRQLISVNTKVIDAKGKLVIPGFNDSHVHFFGVGGRFFSLNLKETKTPGEVLEDLKFYTKYLPDGNWILGGFQTEKDHPLSIMPSKEAIDAVTPNHPVFLYLKGVQIAFANEVALKRAGINKFRPESRMTGILRDSEVSLVKTLTPYISTGDNLAVAETATNYAAAMGVTSVQDVHSDDSFEVYRQLERQGKLKNRIYDCISLLDWQKLANRGIRRASGDAMIRQGCLKFFSLGDPEDVPDLFKMILSADKADIQVMMHAIGPEANDVVLTVFEKLLRQHGKKDRRFRIEHARNFRPQDLKRFAASNTIASMQPALFFNNTGNDSQLFRQMLTAKAFLAFGSDANIIDLNPLLGIYAAVYSGKSGSTKRGLNVEEAVRAYTLDAAYAEFQENVKGSVTVGKLADLIILSDNIFTINPDEIKKVKVLQSIMDGKIVYEAQ